MKNLRLIISLSLLIFLFSSCTKTIEEYYPNGRLKSRIEYRFKKEHGKALYYDEHHRLYIEVTMKRGKKHGDFYKYHFNGKVETQAFYVNDVQEGEEISYDKRGIKIQEIHYVNGVKDGPYYSWHDRDMPFEKGAFKQGLFDGEWRYYDERGMELGEANFTAGTGVMKGYDPNGHLVIITNYKNNLKNGDEIHFGTNGDTLKTINYVDERIKSINNIAVEKNEE